MLLDIPTPILPPVSYPHTMTTKLTNKGSGGQEVLIGELFQRHGATRTKVKTKSGGGADNEQAEAPVNDVL